jgi:hypothetical protein
VDYHTVENRAKRKALQERRNVIRGEMESRAAAAEVLSFSFLPWDVRPGKPTLANVQADSSRRPSYDLIRDRASIGRASGPYPQAAGRLPHLCRDKRKYRMCRSAFIVAAQP